MISIPLIFLSILIVLSCIHIMIPSVFDLNFAILASIVLLIYYFSLNWQLALLLTPIFILFCWIATWFSYPYPTMQTIVSFLIMFAIGCVVHYAGFFMEGKSPSIKLLLQQAVFAPLMMASELFFLFGWMPELKSIVHLDADNIKQ